jgi:hypothetical protein
MLLKVERRTIGLRKEGGIDSTFVAILQTGRGKKFGNFSGVNGVGLFWLPELCPYTVARVARNREANMYEENNVFVLELRARYLNKRGSDHVERS